MAWDTNSDSDVDGLGGGIRFGKLCRVELLEADQRESPKGILQTSEVHRVVEEISYVQHPQVPFAFLMNYRVPDFPMPPGQTFAMQVWSEGTGCVGGRGMATVALFFVTDTPDK